MPYWTVAAEFKKNGQSVKAYYYPQRINSLSKANLIVDACRNQDGNVAEVKTQDIALSSEPVQSGWPAKGSI